MGTHPIFESDFDCLTDMKVVPRRKPEKKDNPPVLSNDWIIQNHGDIAACVAVFFVLGLMFQTTKKAANYFIALQYPEKSYELDDGFQSQEKSPSPIHPMIAEEKPPETNNEPIYHKIGMRDASTLIFYTTLIIVWHAALQEYVFDKCVRRLHLSKTRTSKFSEMGQLFVWFVLNAAWGSSLCYNFGFFQKPSKLWDEWPHDLITWEAKLYYIFQISFWVHQYPELYLQRVKTEEIANRVTYSTVYLILTILPYSLGFWKSGLMLINLHFVGESFISGQNIISSIPFFRPVMELVNNISSAIFVIVRMISLALTVMTFHLGFAHQPEVDWNTSKTRIFALCVVSLVQIYQMWLFLGNRVKKWREHKRTKRD